MTLCPGVGGNPKTAFAEPKEGISEDLLKEVMQTGVGVPQAEKVSCACKRGKSLRAARGGPQF